MTASRTTSRSANAAPPRIVYDDQCGFCTWSVEYALARGDFEPVGFSELTPEQRERLPDDFEDCAHLLTDDSVYSCGEAAEKTLELLSPATGSMFGVLRRVPGYDRIRERIYQGFARNRGTLGKYRSSSPPASE